MKTKAAQASETPRVTSKHGNSVTAKERQGEKDSASPSGPMPNFFVIGASKTGTTSLHDYLGQHPDIFMSSVKEPGFFLFEGTDGRAVWTEFRYVTSLDHYRDLFRGVRSEKVIGESSPFYLDHASQDIIARFKRLTPEAKFIAILRHPVDQAFSRYVMLQRGGKLPDDKGFESFLHRQNIAIRRSKGTLSFERGLQTYSDKIKLYVENFERHQIKICRYDDYADDPKNFLASLFSFLDVDSEFTPDFARRKNVGVDQRPNLLRFILNRPNLVRAAARLLLPPLMREDWRDRLVFLNRREPPRLSSDQREEFTGFFADEIKKLQDVSGLDLSAWLP